MRMAASAFAIALSAASAALPGEGGAPPTGVLVEDSLMYSDSVCRHYYYALPEGYAPDTPAPLLVWLHGGVSTEELADYGPEVLTDRYPIPQLMDMGFILALPCGQAGATWWDPVGQEGILEIVASLKSDLSIDDSRVLAGGFSDGASGSLGLMMLSPSPFAGYLAFSGHPGVAAIDGGRATYLTSLSNRPGIASHTDLDGLYPASEMAPAMELARSAGASIEYYTLDGYGHDAGYLPLLEEEVLAFADSVRRERFPRRISWRAGEPSGCDWLRVDSVVPWPVLTTDSDNNMVMVSERISIGFIPDWEAEGCIPVVGVPEGDSPANRAGLLPGDTLVSFNGAPLGGLDDLSELKGEMEPGDPFTMEVVRDGASVMLDGRLNPPEHYWLFSRRGPSVTVQAEREGNRFRLQVNRLCTVTLLLHPEMVDLDGEIAVSCNGHRVFTGQVEETPGMADSLLEATGDCERLYTAKLRLDLEELLMPLMAD